MYYAKSTNGFYTREIHGDNIPSDAVEITEARHAELLEGQSNGKIITTDEQGYPILVDPPLPTPEELLAQAKRNRAAAYIAEADPLFFKAQRGDATMEEWLAKITEIKNRYPDPNVNN